MAKEVEVFEKIRGQTVMFDTWKAEFSVTVDGQKFTAKSLPSLRRKVNEYKKIVYEKLILLGWRALETPRIVKAVKKGNRWYELDKEGKHRPLKHYLYRYNEKLFKQLEELSQQAKLIENEFDKLGNKLVRIE